MNLVLLGVNHKTAPVELREKLGSLVPEVGEAYRRLLSYPEIQEVLLYNTCNRVEVIGVTEAAEAALERLKTFFASHPEISGADLEDSL